MKKFTLSHRVVAGLFLVVMVLLLTIAYIGSQQTQVYRGRANYGPPTPTTIGAPSPTTASCPFRDVGACYNSGCSVCTACAGGGARCTVTPPTPTTASCPFRDVGACYSSGCSNCVVCTGGGARCTVTPPTPTTAAVPTLMCQYSNITQCQQSGCTSCAGCPDNSFTCGSRYVTSTPRPPTPTNSFRPTATPTPRYGGYPTNTPRPQPTNTVAPPPPTVTRTVVATNTPRPNPTNTPRPGTLSPTPTGEPGSPTVLGDVNVADCTQITGWSGDTDDPNRANRVRIYADGNKTHGTLLGSTRANYARERAICRALGGANCEVCPAEQPQCKHGFAFTVPESLKDGNAHTIYTYGTNLNETPGSDKKIGDTKTITCTVNVPSSTPTVSGPTPTVSGPTPTTSPTCATKSIGDANYCDGVVDGIDYVIWLNSQCNPGANQTCADLKADFNGDAKVNDDDYQIWFNNRT